MIKLNRKSLLVINRSESIFIELKIMIISEENRQIWIYQN